MVIERQTISKRFIAYTLTLLAISVVLLVADHQGQLSIVRNSIQTTITTPIKRFSKWPQSSVAFVGDYFSKQSTLLEENRAQSKEIAWLKTRLANQTVLEAENRRLKMLFESTANQSRPVSIAEVTDSYIDSTRHEIEINKGSNQDAYVGQIVIDENGVVGQITRTTPNFSTVGLITDARQRIPVFIERNRTRLVASGTGYLDELELSFASVNADIRQGDKLVTSGLGGRFPRGYQIGEVTSIERNPANQYAIIKAKPYAALYRVLEVLLIDSDANFERRQAPALDNDISDIQNATNETATERE